MVDRELNELAIIFEPRINEENGIVSFIPIEVIEGCYDDFNERFVDVNMYSYPHLTRGEYSKGYAIRMPIDKLSLGYPDKSLDEIKKIILEEQLKANYFLGDFDGEFLIIKEDNDKYGLVLDEETKDNMFCLFDDAELKDMMNDKFFEKDDVYEVSYSDNIDSSYEEDATSEEKDNLINPHLLYRQVKETVKGQDDAIKEIVTAIWENQNSDYSSNLILVGPSGTGKTEILRQIANKIEVPLFITGVSGMSQAGYVGTGTDEILKSLLTLTNGDVKKAESAIVVLDEIDKLAYGGYEDGKISTDGVQNELLKIIEDGTFAVEINRNGFPTKEMIRTGNITFIGVGAFNGISTKKINKEIGFNKDINEREEIKEKILPEDLIKFGLKPELVGRMGKIIKLNDLDLNTMKEIIKDSNKSALKSKIKLIKSTGIKLNSNIDEIIEEIAKVAVSKKIGARAITGIVNEMFSEILFDINDPNVSYKELEITKETVTNPKKYILRK